MPVVEIELRKWFHCPTTMSNKDPIGMTRNEVYQFSPKSTDNLTAETNGPLYS